MTKTLKPSFTDLSLENNTRFEEERRILESVDLVGRRNGKKQIYINFDAGFLGNKDLIRFTKEVISHVDPPDTDIDQIPEGKELRVNLTDWSEYNQFHLFKIRKTKIGMRKWEINPISSSRAYADVSVFPLAEEDWIDGKQTFSIEMTVWYPRVNQKRIKLEFQVTALDLYSVCNKMLYDLHQYIEKAYYD